MSTMEEFKRFVKTKPSLATYVNDGQMTWQKFYELYDLYGEKSSIWEEYETRGSTKIPDILKNIDMKSIKEHIETAQKALDFVQELTSKAPKDIPKPPKEFKPINKFFED